MPLPIANPEASPHWQAAHPTYAAAFRCIGPACEDPCCGDWDIPLDQATYAAYQRFPPGKLSALVANFVSISPAGGPPGLFAQIRLSPSGLCPFWDPDHLCGIQKEHGPQLLSATCSIYPRSLSHVDGVLEGTLSLSCPEAARNVLLDPNFLRSAGDLHSGDFRTDNVYELAHTPGMPQRSFSAVRAHILAMARDRTHPIAHRLLAIGALLQRLQPVVAAGGDGAVPAFLAAYRPSPPALDSTPANPTLKLDVLLKLANDRLCEPSCGKRFRAIFFAFVEGVASSGDDIASLRHAEQTWFRPFCQRSPHILENYLLNYLLQNLFPVGRAANDDFALLTMFDEFLLLATQFALLETLLIGLAGRYQHDFAEEHIVQAVQSYTREVEHYPPVLHSILHHIQGRRLDSLAGMSLLLGSWNG